MNDTKLKTILKNIVNKCDGTRFYRLEVNGNSALVYKSGTRYLIEIENTGEIIDIDEHITNVNFDNDVFYAEFDAPFGNFGVNISRDMSSDDIEAELG